MSLTERLTTALRPLLPAFTRRSVRIYLAPQVVVAAAIERGRVAGTVALPVANPGGHWEAPLAALCGLLARPAEALAACPPPHGEAVLAALAAHTPLSVSLSGRWCQSVMAPWSDALLAEPAATRFLHMQLAAVYGDAARSWSVTCDDAPYGQPRAACGIDSSLLHALRDGLGPRCSAIEPMIGTASRMQTGMAAFAIAEPGKLTLATIAHGRLATLCAQPCGPAWRQELERAWQRWTLRLPELDSISAVAVIDLTGQPPGTHALAPLFQPVDTPFGRMPLSAAGQEALCA